MQQNHVTINSMVAECIETSVHLRKSLFNGQGMAANVRRDVATAANLLVAVSIKLEEGERGNDDAAELLDDTTAFGRWPLPVALLWLTEQIRMIAEAARDDLDERGSHTPKWRWRSRSSP